jgi:hypothetical protein
MPDFLDLRDWNTDGSGNTGLGKPTRDADTRRPTYQLQQRPAAARI